MNTRICFSISFLILISLSASIFLGGCGNNTKTKRYELTGDTIADGKNLVQLNCTRCHALVPVNSLTKDVWAHTVLPAMSSYLGLTYYMDGYFKKADSGLTLLEWQNIVSYYKKMAPDSLPASQRPAPVVNSMAGFSIKAPKPVSEVALTTLAVINDYNHKIYTSDDAKATFREWNSDLTPAKALTLPSTAVSATFVKNHGGEITALLSCIGVLGTTDFPNGKLVGVNVDNDKAKQQIAESELMRPVQTITADFDKDGLMDRVVCEQGNVKGGVYLFKPGTGNSFKKITVSDQPGAVKAVTGDFNKDGWPDLMVLFGRGDEGLTMFLNDQNGGFTKTTLLRFPPVYGSTNFELADIDHDGNPDLIYSCGYNFGKSRILKPYHGLYIYKNTGNWNFKQQWFYPINGCTNFVTADFNGDGKLDIVTTAFYANLKDNPAEGCMYFEQDGAFGFKPYTLPVSKYGRWMTMGVGDYNNDGRPDIVLGNYAHMFNIQAHVKQSWSINTPFIILQNDFKK